MKKTLLSLVAIATISLSVLGQAPEGFKYQAVVRDAGNLILNNQAVGMRLTVQQGSIGGTAVYTETFATTTNAYGLVNLEIGTGTTTDDFTTIDWSNGPYFMETAVDFLGGMTWVVMGTSQLMSVPYALHANTAENVMNDLVDDADADPTNEMNTGVVLNGTDLEVTDGNGTIVTDLSSLQDGVTDADSDPNNEIQAVSFSNDTLYLSNGGQVYLGAYSVDLVDDADADPTNELQDWSNLPGIPPGLSDGTDDVDDADADPTNELQDWSNLPGIPAGLADGTDDVDDADSDPANEIQAINRSGTTVTLSNGGGTFQDSVGVYTAGSGIDITGNVISTSTIDCGLEVGDTYQGGIIFYLDASGCHGLISTQTDLSSGVQWYNGSHIDTRAYGSGLFEGKYNTKIINIEQGGITSAAAICEAYTGGSFNDWYLPSIEELGRMYDLYQLGFGGFAGVYWSSTEYDYNSAWELSFGFGSPGYSSKTGQNNVRAVRAF